MQKTIVLVVDDEADMRRTMEFRLQGEGYEVLTSANGTEALETLRKGRVDLVLADFMMPEMNGIELTRTIKSHPLWFDTQVLLFSCNPEPEFRRKAIELGAVDYLSKTIGATTIVDKIREIRPPGPADDSSEAGEDDFRLQLASLSQSLVDMLQIADSTAGQPETSGRALRSAQRIADDIRKLTGDEQVVSS